MMILKKKISFFHKKYPEKWITILLLIDSTWNIIQFFSKLVVKIKKTLNGKKY